MDDFRTVIVEELKAINRKLERMDTHFNREIEPLKAHVTQVRFVTWSIAVVVPIIAGIVGIVLRV